MQTDFFPGYDLNMVRNATCKEEIDKNYNYFWLFYEFSEHKLKINFTQKLRLKMCALRESKCTHKL